MLQSNTARKKDSEARRKHLTHLRKFESYTTGLVQYQPIAVNDSLGRMPLIRRLAEDITTRTECAHSAPRHSIKDHNALHVCFMHCHGNTRNTLPADHTRERSNGATQGQHSRRLIRSDWTDALFTSHDSAGSCYVTGFQPCWERLSVSVNLSAWARVASWGGVGAILR